MLVREERYAIAMRELSAARREMRANYYAWSNVRLINEYEYLSGLVTTGGYLLLPAKVYQRNVEVQKFRMVKNEMRRRGVPQATPD